MNKKLDITISEEASFELKKLLQIYKNDYSCVRLSYVSGCCKKSIIDIYLDDFKNKENFTTEIIHSIPFIYNDSISNNIKNIELIYKNSSFMIKSISKKNSSSLCSNEHKNCESCGGCKKTNR
ncbi:hypothetical protein OW763_04115 [Clostridium aestuarii]|uniref:FeS cluster biogenesis domain-containing protein n=1 Tax=Clostridium aestuarii TaxID=338193 RepID=A0ABT4CX18_9CLOT|nr:hypothetical protein [Clostridium aestuarii]MCY6483544.1 hypothetical protein [Clostridium aestuarii]